MISEALQSELFRLKFHSLGSKILKIPEFNLVIVRRFWSIYLNSIHALNKSQYEHITHRLSCKWMGHFWFRSSEFVYLRILPWESRDVCVFLNNYISLEPLRSVKLDLIKMNWMNVWNRFQAFWFILRSLLIN